MDIEIIVLHGEREVKDDGTVKWHGLQKRSSLVTYFHDDAVAKEEALRITKVLLKQLPNAGVTGAELAKRPR